ncbi:MAG: hypothetical protein GF392_02935 [Candidatus Omnitrophica bacterium]|nr:hypothetical protein [Candidatus Omnitrophota bacterium]
MSKKKILILGGGFAGTSALNRLAKLKRSWEKEYEVLLVDRKENSEFLPLLPDLISGRMSPEAMRTSLPGECGKRGARFIRDNIREIKPDDRRVALEGGTLDYEYLILATGAQNNFFGNQNARDNCYKVYEVDEGISIRKALTARSEKGSFNVVIIGGGYTGIEAATNVYRLFQELKRDVKIVMVEKAPDILMMTPKWMRKYGRGELNRLNIKVYCGDGLSEVRDGQAVLDSGRTIDNAFCLWSAGVKASEFIEKTPFEKEKTRVKVAPTLRTGESDRIFCAGDAASFIPSGEEKPIRMAVMFAIAQGKTAAENIVRSIEGKTLKRYVPRDLGYLIPFATGKAPGVVMGVKVKGRLGFWMHYFMSVFRSSCANGLAMIRFWLTGK